MGWDGEGRKGTAKGLPTVLVLMGASRTFTLFPCFSCYLALAWMGC